MKHILVAVDEDPFAEHVVLEAGRIAQKVGAPVCHVMPEHVYRDIVHSQVVDRPTPSMAYTVSMDFYFRSREAWETNLGDRYRFTIEQAIRQAEEAAETAAQPLKQMEVDYDAVGLVGQPAQELVALARKLGSGLIVIGFEALHGLGKLRALGSTARAVLEHAPCPVLTVPLNHATAET